MVDKEIKEWEWEMTRENKQSTNSSLKWMDSKVIPESLYWLQQIFQKFWIKLCLDPVDLTDKFKFNYLMQRVELKF